MEAKTGAQISIRAVLQAVFILLILMLAAGVLTRLTPAGSYQRIEQNGRTVILPDTFAYTERPNYPVWRWFTAPIEVLWGSDSLVVIIIIVFILLVSASFSLLEKSGILQAALEKIVSAFGSQKYKLLLAITFFFMVLGAFLGLFEEVVPLTPLMIALAYSLGWDALVGLGMSILATNLGFSAALTNPFTIGVAQKLAELPAFSGFGFRLPIFLVIYAIAAVFLTRYARKIEQDPTQSLLYGVDQSIRERFSRHTTSSLLPGDRTNRSLMMFGVFVGLIILVLISGPIFPLISDISLPLVGILFFAGGSSASITAGARGQTLGRAIIDGVLGIAPGIPLILMAASVKHIVASGGVIDTILHSAAQTLQGASPFAAALIIYGLALLIEFFIGSAGAKAVLMMPIILPLADLVGVTRQITVTAYCFGDGFSNLAYPTNPVLLIVLGLAGISYSRWMRWTLPLWLVVLPVTVIFLAIAVAVGLGPF